MKQIAKRSEQNSLLFLKSAFTEEGSFRSVSETIEWLTEQNSAVHVDIRKTTFDQMSGWTFDDVTDNIRHESGKFFSIDGIHVRTNWGSVPEWEQPIINQPEIGYLGIITHEFNGVLHFLMQAKIEPGNVNYVQLSPTLQATKSNYTQVHKGKKPLYLEFFRDVKPEQILLDQLQSEQGARFLKKRNRNIIIKLEEEIPAYDNFIWLTLGQIKKLISHNNLVNMDSRTVISGIPFGSYEPAVVDFFNSIGNTGKSSDISHAFLKSALSVSGSIHSTDEIMAFLTRWKCDLELEIRKIPLTRISGWEIHDHEIRHKEDKYFKVIPVEVEIGNREVVRWNQPMVEPAQEGLVAFICREINGILHFAVQAKLECGNFDVIEFAPTVQCLTGNYIHSLEGKLPFLDYILNCPKDEVIFDSFQSEEGGRFYREQNRNMIVICNESFPIDLPPNYIWMTLNQLYDFLKYNNFLNIQARSLISAISFI